MFLYRCVFLFKCQFVLAIHSPTFETCRPNSVKHSMEFQHSGEPGRQVFKALQLESEFKTSLGHMRLSQNKINKTNGQKPVADSVLKYTAMYISLR